MFTLFSLPAFDEVTPDEVEKLLGDSTTKQCELDTAPVWIMKTLRAVFAPILALHAYKHLDLAGNSSIFSQTRHYPPSAEKTGSGFF